MIYLVLFTPLSRSFSSKSTGNQKQEGKFESAADSGRLVLRLGGKQIYLFIQPDLIYMYIIDIVCMRKNEFRSAGGRTGSI
jgi:hypothetical protein